MSVAAETLIARQPTDWRRILPIVFQSRALDDLEESQLVPARDVL